MPTSLHIPKHLLDAIDRKARALNISRNRLILRAVGRELSQSREWSPEFFARLRRTDDRLERDVDEMLQHVRSARRSKPPVDL